MDWGGLVLLGVVVWLVVRLLIPRATRGAEANGEGRDDGEAEGEGGPVQGHRVAQLCRELTGDPRRDRALQNRILALGPGILPLILEAHAETLKNPDGVKPAVLARLEETVADFGLAAVPVVTAQIVRVNPTSPAALSLLRILARLGAGAAAPVLRAGLGQPGLAPYLPRWRLPEVARKPSAVLQQVLRERPPETRPADLGTLAGLLGDHPSVLPELWNRWTQDEAGRLALLQFQAEWPPLAQPALVEAGLGDASVEVRLAAARLATLLHEPSLTAALAGRLTSDPEPAVREACVRALATDVSRAAREALLSAASDQEAGVAVAARHALRLLAPEQVLPPPAETARGPRLDLLMAAEAGDVDALLGALDGPDPDVAALAADLLADHVPTDPRAKERLFRAADGQDNGLAATAALALARTGEADAPELLARRVRDPGGPEALLAMQSAAQVIGPAAAIPLARRLRADGGARAETLLAVLRAVPYATAVPAMLRALEATRGTRAEGLIAATLAVGGSSVRAALEQALQHPGRGLLTPALAWLSAYATPQDLPILLDLLDRHPPLRGIVLGLIEAQGEPAREALRGRIPKGGDDAALLAMEQRLAILDACLGLDETA